VSHAGACGSKNVGTSNRKEGEIPSRRKIKVSKAMTISFGLVGPKEMEKSASDGQQVNIPALLVYAMEGRRVVCRTHYGFEVCMSHLEE
jgi:hypothetical protein